MTDQSRLPVAISKAAEKLTDGEFYLRYCDLNKDRMTAEQRARKLAQAVAFAREARSLATKRDPDLMTVAATKVVAASYALEDRVRNDYGYREDNE